jgi:hypothetical protein
METPGQALNMLTRTSAQDYALDHIYMNRRASVCFCGGLLRYGRPPTTTSLLDRHGSVRQPAGMPSCMQQQLTWQRVRPHSVDTGWINEENPAHIAAKNGESRSIASPRPQPAHGAPLN